ncbi:hypothetical protein J437_LFUL015188 [Ladona fulva]|uniref:Uncharacterized protein n=1 Tax=Ladona fulva TaxID=123851 RepID=A0A8K0KIY1_LADFU|nr:hypothetical protein J437_LFUL015188 [Ladona fulva]
MCILTSSKLKEKMCFILETAFGDILKSKKIRGWKTFFIVSELVQEPHVWTDKCQPLAELQNLGILTVAHRISETSKLRNSILDITHKIDLAYGMMGGLF